MTKPQYNLFITVIVLMASCLPSHADDSSKGQPHNAISHAHVSGEDTLISNSLNRLSDVISAWKRAGRPQRGLAHVKSVVQSEYNRLARTGYWDTYEGAEVAKILRENWGARSGSAHVVLHNPSRIAQKARITPMRSRRQASVASQIYADTGSNHWIQDVGSDGTILTLEDGSIWKVDAVDTADTVVWVTADDVVVLDGKDPSYPYRIINKDEQGEIAHAQYLGMK